MIVEKEDATEMGVAEHQDRQYRKKRRELLLGRMRASTVRGQLTTANEIVERISFELLSDTAFRDKIHEVKVALAVALNDFLLKDSYWEKRIFEHEHFSPAEYAAHLGKQLVGEGKPATMSPVASCPACGPDVPAHVMNESCHYPVADEQEG